MIKCALEIIVKLKGKSRSGLLDITLNIGCNLIGRRIQKKIPYIPKNHNKQILACLKLNNLDHIKLRRMKHTSMQALQKKEHLNSGRERICSSVSTLSMQSTSYEKNKRKKENNNGKYRKNRIQSILLLLMQEHMLHVHPARYVCNVLGLHKDLMSSPGCEGVCCEN